MWGATEAQEKGGNKNQLEMWEERQCSRVRMKLVKILTVKIFMNLDTTLRKSLKKKKKQHTSLKMNEIPEAHLQTTFSSSIQLL